MTEFAYQLHPVRSMEEVLRPIEDFVPADTSSRWKQKLHRLLHWLCRKANFAVVERHPRVEYQRVETRSALESVAQSVTVLKRLRADGNAAKCVLVGRQFLRELQCDLEFNDARWMGRAEPRVVTTIPDPDGLRPMGVQQMQVYGLDVFLVPWMEGMVVLPDLKEIAKLAR